MYEFKVDKMHCMSCFRNIEDSMKDFDENIKVTADVANQVVIVETSHPIEKIQKLIEDAGYPVSGFSRR